MNSNKASALLRFEAQIKRLFGWNRLDIHSRYSKYNYTSDKPSGAARRRAVWNRPRKLHKGVWRLNIWQPHPRVLRGRQNYAG